LRAKRTRSPTRIESEEEAALEGSAGDLDQGTAFGDEAKGAAHAPSVGALHSQFKVCSDVQMHLPWPPLGSPQGWVLNGGLHARPLRLAHEPRAKAVRLALVRDAARTTANIADSFSRFFIAVLLSRTARPTDMSSGAPY
jgi:hypothetical protein